MREIKFRAWHEGYAGTAPPVMLYDEQPGDCLYFQKQGQPVHVMQYTGLKDKNGKEIYEGDIVLKCDPEYWRKNDEEPDAEDLAFYRGGTAEVVITKYGVQMDEIECGEWCFNGPEGRDWNESELEVIGNIYANPELKP